MFGFNLKSMGYPWQLEVVLRRFCSNKWSCPPRRREWPRAGAVIDPIAIFTLFWGPPCKTGNWPVVFFFCMLGYASITTFNVSVAFCPLESDCTHIVANVALRTFGTVCLCVSKALKSRLTFAAGILEFNPMHKDCLSSLE